MCMGAVQQFVDRGALLLIGKMIDGAVAWRSSADEDTTIVGEEVDGYYLP